MTDEKKADVKIVPEQDRICRFCSNWGDPTAKKEGVLKKCRPESEIQHRNVYTAPGQVACPNFEFSEEMKDAFVGKTEGETSDGCE